MMLTVSVDEVVAGFGLNVPSAPISGPLALKVTGLLKPLRGAIVTLYVVLTTVPPTERVAGVALMEEAAAGFRNNGAGAGWRSVPFTPLSGSGYVAVEDVVPVGTARGEYE